MYMQTGILHSVRLVVMNVLENRETFYIISSQNTSLFYLK